jgi:hypothetical protein
MQPISVCYQPVPHFHFKSLLVPVWLQVRVSESQVKNRLYMGNLPRSMTQHQLEEALKQELQGEQDSRSSELIMVLQSATANF